MSSSWRQVGVSTILVALLGTASLYGQDPVAFINQPLVPTSVAPGSGAFTLTVNGTGFTVNSIVHWNGNAQTTTFVNSGQVTAAIAALEVASPTTAEVGVDNPAPGGIVSTRSNIVFFHVTNPAASIAMGKTDYAVGDQPVFVATQDFNSDGMLDLAVANAQGDTISILLGNGDGTFLPTVPPTFATGVGPFFVTAGDFNADGKLDLAVSNLSGNTVSILLGNGDGTFQANEDYPTGSFPFSVTTADFNADGKLDLAVTNRSDDTVSILLGNGNGTFQTQTTFVTGSGPVSPMAGDFNGDGDLDLAVANAFADTVSILLGSGTGTFSANVDFATASNPVSVTTADLNADGKLDLAVANAGDDTVSILLGNGDGTFLPTVPPTFATGAFPLSVTTGEFSGDGMLDLAVPNSSDNTVSILLGNGDGTFQTQSTFATGSAPRFPAAGDFNGDGKLDLAVANRSDDTVSVLLQTPPAGPAVQLSTNSLTFGNQVVNTTSSVMQVTLTNSGTATLNISNIALSGADAARFTIAAGQTTCTGATVLVVNDTCAVGVTFSPTAEVSYSASLDITSDATNSPTLVPLTGTGVPSAAAISVAPANLDFGTHQVSTTTSLLVTVTNTGTGNLMLAGINLGGANAANFAVDGGTTCAIGVPIAPNASCNIGVDFTAPAVDTRNATLVITSDAGNAPIVNVGLIGRGSDGSDFFIAAQAGGSTSGTITAGQSISFPLQVEAAPGVTGTAVLGCLESITDATCSVFPGTVILNDADPAEFNLSLLTAARSAGTTPMLPPNPGPGLPMTLPATWLWVAASLLMLGTLATSRRRARVVLMAAMLFVMVWSSCVGNSVVNRPVQRGGTPAGIYNVTVTATVNGFTKSQIVVVTVN